MEIKDINQDDRIIIHVTKEGSDRFGSFESKARISLDGSLLTDPFVHEGILLGFASNDIRIDMMVVNTTLTPFLFKNVTIRKVEYDGTLYHMITATTPGVKINRRTNYRLFIGESARITIGDSDHGTNGILKDISANGFAVMFDKQASIDFKMHTKLKVHFSDPALKVELTLTGRVIRREDSLEHYTLYGCVAEKESAAIRKYIAQKQTSKLSHVQKKPLDK